MKIAVATDDFKTVTGHVGRCNGFLVYEILDGKIVNQENEKIILLIINIAMIMIIRTIILIIMNILQLIQIYWMVCKIVLI